MDEYNWYDSINKQEDDSVVHPEVQQKTDEIKKPYRFVRIGTFVLCTFVFMLVGVFLGVILVTHFSNTELYAENQGTDDKQSGGIILEASNMNDDVGNADEFLVPEPDPGKKVNPATAPDNVPNNAPSGVSPPSIITLPEESESVD